MKKAGFAFLTIALLSFALACGGGSSGDDGGATTSTNDAAQNSYDDAVESMNNMGIHPIPDNDITALADTDSFLPGRNQVS